MRPWHIYEVPVSRSLQNTELGTVVAMQKLHISERKKWKKFTWVRDVERETGRYAVLLAEERRDANE